MLKKRVRIKYKPRVNIYSRDVRVKHCIICSERFQNHETITRCATCTLAFHQDCQSQWLYYYNPDFRHRPCTHCGLPWHPINDHRSVEIYTTM